MTIERAKDVLSEKVWPSDINFEPLEVQMAMLYVSSCKLDYELINEYNSLTIMDQIAAVTIDPYYLSAVEKPNPELFAIALAMEPHLFLKLPDLDVADQLNAIRRSGHSDLECPLDACPEISLILDAPIPEQEPMADWYSL